jgi:DNA-binding beta-propeller fold protein YncE
MRLPSLVRRTSSFFLLGCVFAYAADAQQTLSENRLRQIALIQLPGQPGFDHVAYANGNVVISHAGAKSVDVFNPQKRRLVAQIQGVNDPRGIAVDEESKSVFIADAANKSVAVVSSEDWQIKKLLALPAPPQEIIYVPGEAALYVSALNNAHLMYVPIAGGEVANIDVGGRIGGLAFDPAGHRIFASLNNQDELAMLPAARAQSKVAERWHLSASQPTGLAFDPEMGRLFVAVRYAVVSLNASTGQEISRVPTAAGTDTLQYDPRTQLIYAGSTNGTISTIGAAKGTLVAENEVQTDVKGHNFAVDPQNHCVYLPGGREGKSKLVILKPFTMHPESDGDDQDATGTSSQTSPQNIPKR